jgi:hypothetical protein
MTRPPDPRWGAGERRDARIRELREQRQGPMRRRRKLQPAVLIAWFAGSIALAGLGDVSVELWPGWVDRVPRLGWRIRIELAAPDAG